MPSPTRPLAALVCATGLLLGACGGGADQGTAAPAPAPTPTATPAAAGTAAGTAPATAEELEPARALPVVPTEAGHLHGVAVDPADGRVLLATHAGLMVVEPDGVRRVGEAQTDLMGFVVAGPQRYYASGHPGPGDDLPDPVGLIESTDGGLTWTSLSLAGRSDFHALTAGAGRVYGYDGALRRSTDGLTWSDGSGDVRPASLAVHPEDPDTVVATTEEGPLRSVDGGTSFTALPGAPLVVHLAWVSPDTLWAVAPDGTLHVSADAGTTWERRGQVDGPPEAFGAAEGAVLVATADHVLRSEDGGLSFEPLALRG